MNRNGNRATNEYKRSLVNFIQDLEWDFFITIGIGFCPDDDELLKRLRLIEAKFCKKYVMTKYHKLPHRERFSTVVAFEGEKRLGNRHAHILVHIPQPRKKWSERSTLISLFCWEFRFMWHQVTPFAERCGSVLRPIVKDAPLTFGRVNAARETYTVKSVQSIEVPWSRFEFVTPPKAKTFENENLSVIRNRDRQKRIALQKCKPHLPESIT
jgi:hypothetical protein